MVVTGNPETKNLKDMLPDALKQFGPQQLNFLKSVMGNIESVKEANKAQEEDEDDVPELVGTNFEEASKQWAANFNHSKQDLMRSTGLILPKFQNISFSI